MMVRHWPRILLYAENFVVGGGERYLRDLVRGLVDNHCEVRIGCRGSTELLDYLRAIHDDVPVDALPILTITSSAAYRLGQKSGAGRDPRFDRLRSATNAAVSLAHMGPNVAVIRQWLKQHQPDIFHINNGGYPGGESCRAAAVAGRLACVPVVSMFVHSQAGPRRWPTLEEAAIDGLISRGLDTVVVASDAVGETLIRRRGFPRCQITRIPNGISLPPLRPALTAAERGQRGLPTDGLVIGVVGRLDTNKGQGYVLEAAALLSRDISNLSVVVVGSGSSKDEYRALAERLGIGSRTVFTGQRDDVLELMRGFDVFVMPTVEYEGLGYALLEAMSVGLPAVVTRVGGMPEAVDGGRAGLLVEPRDVPGLATALLPLLRNPEERQRLGQAARARAMAEYSVERMVERTLSHYRGLLRTPPTFEVGHSTDSYPAVGH